MENLQIPYKKTGYFSKMMLDYIAQEKSVAPFYNRFPSLENFTEQLKEKSEFYTPKSREVLVGAIKNQYQNIEKSTLTTTHIDLLSKSNTYTITTGHQLNLFSGPLYFLYKIISVINLCKDLKKKHPQHNFVPVYWMASEDHDFEEIQYFNFKNTKLTWNRTGGGAVGRLSTEGLEDVFAEFSSLLNSGKNAEQLRSLFKKSYLEHNNLTEASRFLVNELFGDYGLIIVDGDDKELKSLFKSYALRELKEEITFSRVTETNKKIEASGYKVQVNPREINLFYIADGIRERIIKQGSTYKINNTDLVFENAEALFANSDTLEFVSGNALLRPLYQEVILPNLCYVGGGGELAYWMQLKSTFTTFKVPFPILLLRNSALLISEKQQQKLKKLDASVEDLFLSPHEFIKKKVLQKSTIQFSFSEKKQILESNFKELEKIALQTDPSFIGAVKAQKVKQLKGLDNLEKRLLKAETKKMETWVTSLKKIQKELFPDQTLEERKRNFSEYYQKYGNDLIGKLQKSLNPLELSFSVIEF